MSIPKVFASEYRFCCILWEYEPIKSSDLVKLCNEKLEWKKSTTFTVLSAESHDIIDKTFGGSLPQFIAAFTKDKGLSTAEITEIKRMIEQFEEES